MLRVKRAVTTRLGGAAAPLRYARVGATNRSYVTMHDTGLPGRPNTALSPHTARMVGLPGFNDTPWTSTPGLPRLSTTCAVMSRALTELPADRMRTSFSDRAFCAAVSRAEYSSGNTPARTGSWPPRLTNAASVYELISRIWPGPGVCSGST